MPLAHRQGINRAPLAAPSSLANSSPVPSLSDSTSSVSDVSQPENEVISFNMRTTPTSTTLTVLERDSATFRLDWMLHRYLTDYDHLEEFFASPLPPASKPISQWSALKRIRSVTDEAEKKLGYRFLAGDEIFVYPARIRVPTGENAPWDINTGEERTTPLRGPRTRRPLRRRSLLSIPQPLAGESRHAPQTSTRRLAQTIHSGCDSTGAEPQDPSISGSTTREEEFSSFAFTNSSIDHIMTDSWNNDWPSAVKEDAAQAVDPVVLADLQQNTSRIWPSTENRAPGRPPISSNQFYFGGQSTASVHTLATSFNSSPSRSRTSNLSSIANNTVAVTHLAQVPREISTVPALSPNYSTSSYSDPQEEGTEASTPWLSNPSPASASSLPQPPLVDEPTDKQAGNVSGDLGWMQFVEDQAWEMMEPTS